MPLLAQGSGKGEPLVLMPGGLTGWVSWLPHAERLAPHRRIWRLQLRSVEFGDAGLPLPEGYSPATEKAALAETLTALGLSPPVDIVGWSYGAMVTLDFALDHPSWVRTMTLIEPPAFWVLPDDGRGSDLGPRLNSKNISEDELREFVEFAGFVRPGANALEHSQWPIWSAHRQSLRAIPSILSYKADDERLESFEPPVLLVKGTGSTQFYHRIIDELAGRLPHAEVAEWPAGHAPHIVSIDLFLDRLAAFQHR